MTSNEKHILFVISNLNAGGAQRIMVSLIAHLITKRYKITCVTLGSSEDDFFNLPEGCRRIGLDLMHSSSSFKEALTYNFKRIKALRSVIAKEAPDVVVSFLVTTNILTILATIFMRVHLVICERNDPSRQNPGRLWDVMRRIFYRMADSVSANSMNAIEAMKAYVPEYKLRFIPNHLSRPPFDEIQPYGQRKNVVLSVGRLHPQKGMDTLIHAFAGFSNSVPDWELVILGKGELLPDLKSLASSLGVGDKVIFKGAVENPYEYYCSSKVFVLASLFEGTPNALLEAMSCKTVPIVSSTCVECLSFIDEGESGLIFPVCDSESLTKELIYLATHSDYASSISDNAQQAVRSRYNGEMLTMWENLFR